METGIWVVGFFLREILTKPQLINCYYTWVNYYTIWTVWSSLIIPKKNHLHLAQKYIYILYSEPTKKSKMEPFSFSDASLGPEYASGATVE